MTKYDWDTGTEVPSVELVHNATEKYNNMIAAKEWTKTDLKYAKIISLTTRLSKCERNNTSVHATF